MTRTLLALLLAFAGCDSCQKREPPSTCCKICTTGQPCGDTCIPATDTCHKAPGCACAK